MTSKNQSLLRQKLVARNERIGERFKELHIPATGRIDIDVISAIQELAVRAHGGDMAARDHLFKAMQPRFDRISWALKPWPSTPHIIGVWDRGDVRQETWLIFMELLTAWEDSVPFIPYVLARFSWRLRDRILRGIGRSLGPAGSIRISESALAEVLSVTDTDQPESIVIARELLQELMSGRKLHRSETEEIEDWLGLTAPQQQSVLVSPVSTSSPKPMLRVKRLA